MGLNNREKATYVKIAKDGKLYKSSDKDLDNPYEDLEGVIKNIALRKDTYEGNEIEKLQITMNDGEDDYILGIGFNSASASALIGFLKNADLTQPLALVPVAKEENGEIRKTILVRQNGKYMKQFYTKDSPNGLPPITEVLDAKGKQVKVNGRPVWDKEAFLEFYRGVVTNELIPQINGDAVAPKKQAVTQDYVNDSVDEPADDLPF